MGLLAIVSASYRAPNYRDLPAGWDLIRQNVNTAGGSSDKARMQTVAKYLNSGDSSIAFASSLGTTTRGQVICYLFPADAEIGADSSTDIGNFSPFGFSITSSDPSLIIYSATGEGVTLETGDWAGADEYYALVAPFGGTGSSYASAVAVQESAGLSTASYTAGQDLRNVKGNFAVSIPAVDSLPAIGEVVVAGATGSGAAIAGASAIGEVTVDVTATGTGVASGSGLGSVTVPEAIASGVIALVEAIASGAIGLAGSIATATAIVAAPALGTVELASATTAAAGGVVAPAAGTVTLSGVTVSGSADLGAATAVGSVTTPGVTVSGSAVAIAPTPGTVTVPGATASGSAVIEQGEVFPAVGTVAVTGAGGSGAAVVSAPAIGEVAAVTTVTGVSVAGGSGLGSITVPGAISSGVVTVRVPATTIDATLTWVTPIDPALAFVPLLEPRLTWLK